MFVILNHLLLQTKSICEKLRNIWETEGQCEILYNYYDYLQNDYFVETIQNNELSFQTTNKQSLKCFEAIKNYNNETLKQQNLNKQIECDICFDDFPRNKYTVLEGLKLYMF